MLSAQDKTDSVPSFGNKIFGKTKSLSTVLNQKLSQIWSRSSKTEVDGTLTASTTDIDGVPTGSRRSSLVKVLSHSFASLGSGFAKFNSLRRASMVKISIKVKKSAKKLVLTLTRIRPKRRSKKSKKALTPSEAILNGAKVLPDLFVEMYTLECVLGEGTFGMVFSGVQKATKQRVAVKFITRERILEDCWVEDETLGRVPREIQILHMVDSPFVVKYLDHFDDEQYVILVTEFHGTQWDPRNPILTPEKNPRLRMVDGENKPVVKWSPEKMKEIVGKEKIAVDLFECIECHNGFDEDTARYIFIQIAYALRDLQNAGVVHRDLKDENIVIDSDYNLKLIDFGSASFIPTDPEHYFTKFNGTIHVAAPEIIARKPFSGPAQECWALGVLLYIILFGQNPFETPMDIRRGQYNRFPKQIDEQLAHLIDSLLTYNEEDRITIDEVCEHPWVLQGLDY